ncbi:hypothetical protein SERN_1017 [Serinibacter arcticus]|uniref:Uncharacterized protein n=1 Tax=Serinibacter arcticus TaxID=1655435 RepID=A0A4Z1E3H7_9MICO|nr:hypothetical protein SERN_1017 [Serinibacter arcticus]
MSRGTDTGRRRVVTATFGRGVPTAVPTGEIVAMPGFPPEFPQVVHTCGDDGGVSSTCAPRGCPQPVHRLSTTRLDRLACQLDPTSSAGVIRARRDVR